MQDERQELGYTLCSSSTGKWCVLRAHCGTAKTLLHLSPQERHFVIHQPYYYHRAKRTVACACVRACVRAEQSLQSCVVL
jgi:hypothetical protein